MCVCFINKNITLHILHVYDMNNDVVFVVQTINYFVANLIHVIILCAD